MHVCNMSNDLYSVQVNRAQQMIVKKLIITVSACANNSGKPTNKETFLNAEFVRKNFCLQKLGREATSQYIFVYDLRYKNLRYQIEPGRNFVVQKVWVGRLGVFVGAYYGERNRNPQGDT